jgi:hypothetical protein
LVPEKCRFGPVLAVFDRFGGIWEREKMFFFVIFTGSRWVEGVFVAVVTLQGVVFSDFLGQNRSRASFWYQKSADLVLFCLFSTVFATVFVNFFFWGGEKK